LAGESKPVDTYSATNGTFTLAEALTSAPTVGDEFVLLPDHVHPITAIAAGVRTELATELGRIDVAIGTRLADADYTAPPTATTVADTVLSRALTTAEATAGRVSLCTLVLALTSKAFVTGGVLNVYRTDGTTLHAQIPVASDPNAEPIVGIG
jgi:hypothetical protein